jgi:fructuronate reductase
VGDRCLHRLIKTISNPNIALVTLTITEAGYQPAGTDLEASALGRLLLGLRARYANGAKIALVPCDNLPSNGKVLKKALLSLASNEGSGFVEYLKSISYVTTSIDRITPKTTQADVDLVLAKTGFSDSTPVVTEPFRDWVLEGNFPLGRPKWESAGARFVSEIEPFENRKLWLLNGAHTLMALFGTLRGHQSVDQAIQDEEVLLEVNRFWNEAATHLDEKLLEIVAYRRALIERFSNPRIGYQLSQIAQDSLNKLSVRIAPVALLELKAGRIAHGAVTAIASWIWFVSSGVEIKDSRVVEINGAKSPIEHLQLVSNDLAQDSQFAAAVLDKVAEFQPLAPEYAR